MACPCVSQAVCHSATTASVVWPLALDFIFTRCVSLAPGILILDVVQTRSLLDFLRSIFYVRFFTFDLGEGGNSLNPIQASENIMILETNDCTSSVPT